MDTIKVRRYYLSDFLYDNCGDDPVNIYDGFFVDLMPSEIGDNMTDFWLGYHEPVRAHMFAIRNSDCDTDKKAQDVVKRNGYEYIENFVDRYFNDECEHCDCEHRHKVNGVWEAIEMHNEHVDKMFELGEALLAQYPDIEETPINKAFCEAYNGIVGNAIYLCCEANSLEHGWATDDDWHVVNDEENNNQ